MRIIETVFPIQVPQQPRVFTLEVDENELEDILFGLDSGGVAEDMANEIEAALS